MYGGETVKVILVMMVITSKGLGLCVIKNEELRGKKFNYNETVKISYQKAYEKRVSKSAKKFINSLEKMSVLAAEKGLEFMSGIISNISLLSSLDIKYLGKKELVAKSGFLYLSDTNYICENWKDNEEYRLWNAKCSGVRYSDYCQNSFFKEVKKNNCDCTKIKAFRITEYETENGWSALNAKKYSRKAETKKRWKNVSACAYECEFFCGIRHNETKKDENTSMCKVVQKASKKKDYCNKPFIANECPKSCSTPKKFFNFGEEILIIKVPLWGWEFLVNQKNAYSTLRSFGNALQNIDKKEKDAGRFKVIPQIEYRFDLI